MSGSSSDVDLFPKVYEELRRLANARLTNEYFNDSLSATVLVHEVFLRLGEAAFANRGDFFRAAAVAMQRILVDNARRRKALKRGGGARRHPLEAILPTMPADPDFLLDLNDALNRLATEDSSSAEVARYHLFAGLTIDEAAEVMEISRATAYREWAYARSWLATALDSGYCESKNS